MTETENAPEGEKPVKTTKKIEPSKKKLKKKVKAAKPKKEGGRSRSRIDTSGPRADISIAAVLKKELLAIANEEDLASAGHAADKIISMGIARRRALRTYDKAQKKAAKK